MQINTSIISRVNQFPSFASQQVATWYGRGVVLASMISPPIALIALLATAVFLKAAQVWYQRHISKKIEQEYDLGNNLYQASNFPQAFTHFKIAADLGDHKAQSKVGLMLYYGKGREKSLTEAVKYFKAAALKGNSYAQEWLGYLHIKGEGVEKSLQKAFEFYEKAAVKGSRDAQYGAGVALHDIANSVQNEALNYLQMAAEHGCQEAKDYIAKHFPEHNSKAGI